MGTVYVFFADGFEEIEAFTSVDVMRRAGLKVEMITVTPDEIVTGAHGVPVLCDKNIVNCDFFDADLIVLPGGMPGAATLGECDDLRKLIVRFAEENKPIAAICAAPMVLGKLLTQQAEPGQREGKTVKQIHEISSRISKNNRNGHRRNYRRDAAAGR